MLSEYLSPNWIDLLFLGSAMVLAYLGFTALSQDTLTLRVWQRRIQGLRGASGNAVSSPLRQRHLWWQHLLDFVGTLVRPRRQGEISRASNRLIQAGFRNPRDVNIYYGVKFGLMIFLPGVMFFILQAAPASQTSSSVLLPYAALILSALFGTFVPDAWLQIRIRDRKEQIWSGFPDAMDLLVLCIESGLGVDAAIHRVAEDIHLSHLLLSQELRYVSDSIRTGQTRANALKQLNQRVDLEDIQSFTSLIVQTEKLGVSITQAMRKISESIRAKRQTQAEELASKLPVKLLFPVTLFFFPGIMVVILMPALIELVRALSSIGN